MATIIQLQTRTGDPDNHHDLSNRFKSLLEKKRKGKTEPLTPEKLRRRQGLENLTDEEALLAIDTIKKLATLFFEIACHNEAICIDNQQIVPLNQENKAA